MTVIGLIRALQSFPEDAPAVSEWDGGWANLENPTLEKDLKGRDVLVFDCNEYGTYRRDQE